MDLAGSTALLTGATGGIGHAIAHALHARGATLVVSGRRVEVLEELRGQLGDVRILAVDLADRAGAAELAQRAGPVDVLVANAGLPASGPLDDFSPDEVDRALDVNLRAPVQLTHALLPGMLERGGGHVVFVSSLLGKAATPGSSLYAATKFGLRGFAAGLREDLHGSGVGVTAVFPGFVRGAGMFADAGVSLPWYVGTRSCEQVAAAVVRGIERDRGEVDVAPLGLRLGVKASGVAPGLAARMQRRLGGAGISAQTARGQRSKR